LTAKLPRYNQLAIWLKKRYIYDIMVDDIRHPRENQKTYEDQNKQQNNQTGATPPLEAPHLYGQEEGFVATKATQKMKRRHWPHMLIKNSTPKDRILGGVLVTVLLLGGSGGVYAINKGFNKSKLEPAPAVVQKAERPKPTTEASNLTGLQITPELNKRPVTGVMIENSPDARPQAGLKDAGVVYEAIAEGGITRFLALFKDSQPDYIGPVRSVRPYYVDLLLPYDAALAHAGGSADGLAKVRNLGVKDLDHGANGGAFRRAGDRYAPHNLYTSTADLDKASQNRGYTASAVKSLVRKAEKPGQPITAKSINLTLSSALYNLRYDYDAGSNSYLRSMGGKPHTDHRSGQQLAPKVVVALVMGYSQSGIYSVYQTTGSGKMYVFQDGVVQQGTWTKSGEREQFVFSDDSGKPLALNTGQTWITLIKAPNAVSFTP
jgi:hypothetical protein